MSHHIFFKKKLLRSNGTPTPGPTPEPEINYAKEYLTFEALEDDFQITNTNTNNIPNISVTTQYRTDKEASWTRWNAGTTIKINNGQIIQLKIQFNTTISNIRWIPVVNGKNFNVYGNIMSIIWGEAFIGKTAFPPAISAFNFTLQGSCVVNANNLILPATTLIEGYYDPDTELTKGCYESMFDGCTLLETAPKLPATTLVPSCYKYMFAGCTSLTTSPDLPATTLAESCYLGMFYDCISLTTAQKISAATLAQSCCCEMFYGCTSLTKAPDLLSDILVPHCYESMFKNCEKLNRIKMLATKGISEGDCLTSWVMDVAEEGKFTKNSNAPEIPKGDNGIPEGWTVATSPDANDKDYLKFEALTDVVINIEESGSGTTSNISYSYDKKDWYDWEYYKNGECIELLKGDYIYLKGDNSDGLNNKTGNSYKRFVITDKNGEDNGKIKASGNIMSLLYNDNFENVNTIVNPLPHYCFSRLFSGCTSLTTVPTLPAKYLSQHCYSQMFEGCTSLITGPVLPATTLFQYCYHSMFAGCTSLIMAPVLPATKLAKGCYMGMFTNCTRLQIAPELPATTVTDYCYDSMFRGCVSLENAPDLPATTLAPYCYSEMFSDCYNLNYIKIYADSDQEAIYGAGRRCLYQWVSTWGNDKSSGKFYKKPSTWISSGSYPNTHEYWCSGVPNGWDVKYCSEKGVITFTIDDSEYQAEKGMTWGEFVNSAYSNNDFIIINNIVYDDQTGRAILYMGNDVRYSDNIIENGIYHKNASGGAG